MGFVEREAGALDTPKWRATFLERSGGSIVLGRTRDSLVFFTLSNYHFAPVDQAPAGVSLGARHREAHRAQPSFSRREIMGKAMPRA